ncbi:MAG: DNA polymerase III subunit alpha, partial [Candidatus Eisenbacteria bacterium]
GDCALLDPRDHETHRVAVTAAAGELLERMPASAFCAREATLAAPEEWVRRVRAVCAAAGTPGAAAESLEHNAALAARCRLEIELGVPIFPRAPLPAGVSGPAHLLALCRDGLARRYGPGHRGAQRRLADELGIIERMGFTDYFLLVAEIVGFARARAIPTVGRGSGASSIVAYALGITNVDPLRHGLSFERFLHPARRDCPDLDIDLCWRRRDEVIAHVYETYGHDRVAMIATHATLGARSAFRETAKALGVSNARVNALARRIPREMDPPYRARLEALAGASDVEWSEPPLAQALALAERLSGAPRHLSVHCGGIVIADRALTDYVPLERAAKDVVVTQFEMRAIEAIGLVKMDLLGNRALSTIGECVALARAGAGHDTDVERIPEDDPATAGRVATGDTLNCFQLESPAMRHLLRMLEARTLEDTIAAVALVRPGPAESGMKEAYCRRRRGLEPPAFAHPRLRRVLGPTYGVMLYEEDVMAVAAAVAGLSLAEGDDLRRAIGAARGEEQFRALEGGFVAQAARAGVEEPSARAVWRDLTRFAAYAFCKAHAAGYGTLGWHSAYLKTHFPAEWAVGILNHHAGMYATWVHVEDLRRHGVEFRAPCTQRSTWDARLERDGAATAAGVEPDPASGRSAAGVEPDPASGGSAAGRGRGRRSGHILCPSLTPSPAPPSLAARGSESRLRPLPAALPPLAGSGSAPAALSPLAGSGSRSSRASHVERCSRRPRRALVRVRARRGDRPAHHRRPRRAAVRELRRLRRPRAARAPRGRSADPRGGARLDRPHPPVAVARGARDRRAPAGNAAPGAGRRRIAPPPRRRSARGAGASRVRSRRTGARRVSRERPVVQRPSAGRARGSGRADVRHAGRRAGGPCRAARDAGGHAVRDAARRDQAGRRHALPHPRRPERTRRVRSISGRLPRARACGARAGRARRRAGRGNARRGHDHGVEGRRGRGPGRALRGGPVRNYPLKLAAIVLPLGQGRADSGSAIRRNRFRASGKMWAALVPPG